MWGAHPACLRQTKVMMQAGPLYFAVRAPRGSIWPSMRMELALCIVTMPCASTAPCQPEPPGLPMTPFLIAIGAGTPLGGHLAPGLLPAFDDSLETPIYRPSNAVAGATVCAAVVESACHQRQQQPCPTNHVCFSPDAPMIVQIAV